MLYVSFKTKFGESLIHTVDSYFNNIYEDEWLDDPLVKQMILDVDKSEVLSVNCIQSPVLGQIPPTKLSGGVKCCIMLLKEDDFKLWGPAVGDNCAKWIAKIAEQKDITLYMGHYLYFPDGTKIHCLDTNQTVDSARDWSMMMIRRITEEIQNDQCDC